jgi:ribonuclease BN (tRNA processing enzyme)
MIVRVLGGHGGLAKGFSTTSFLINSDLLIDAGNVAGPLAIEEQLLIENILITHCHLDHIKDLAFLCDNCFGLRSFPFQVHAHKTVNGIIQTHLLNDVVWPDFAKLPTATKPTLSYKNLEPMKKVKLGKYEVTPILVNHPLDAMGFIVDDGVSAVLFSGDTGPTDELWREAKKVSNLKGIFTEVSFPEKLSKVAEISYHHTPQTIAQELKKIPANVPVILTHLKPNYREMIIAEMEKLDLPLVKILENDGSVFTF